VSGAHPLPIVFVIGGDPVRFNLVASFNRPGGNITGVSLITNALGAKRLGLLHDLVPNAAVIGLLVNPDNPNADRIAAADEDHGKLAAATHELLHPCQPILGAAANSNAKIENAVNGKVT
jgi:putative ABC transport system substrate-binding protein